jgi:hypothetical protein
MKKKVD